MSEIFLKSQTMPWDMAELKKKPKVFAASGFSESGVRALFYEALSWNGRATRVFAWYGVPERKANERFPAMVLVHGGGGTAFAQWVRLWTSRGYAAIAMDTCGCTAGGEQAKRPRHEYGGPPNEESRFDDVDKPFEDQWPFHGVADAILANSLIRSFPEVNADRIGITGISWGGYLACIAASIDDRFKCAIPVYGCGFLGYDSAWASVLSRMQPAKSQKWLDLWDPSVYLPNAIMPMLWVTGTNDAFFPLNSLQQSYRLPRSEAKLCIRVRMPHGHDGHGENPAEIHAFADTYLKGGVPLAAVSRMSRRDNQVRADYTSISPLASAELIYTADKGPWPSRYWHNLTAEVNTSMGFVQATLPSDATVYFFNLIDDAGRVVSTEHCEM